jgi:cytochrome c553
MMASELYRWRNPWFRRSVGGVIALAIVAALIGFAWLPSEHADYTAQGFWSAICRAAGVPAQWGEGHFGAAAHPSSLVVADPALRRIGDAQAIGRGGTIALQQCTMCHGPQGVSVSDVPNLAGQFPEVIYKQLRDFQGGQRHNAIMQALAQPLHDRDLRDVAAYYASLPPTNVPREPTAAGGVPRLVRDGDPMRNIAPCAACHGGMDRKPGAPWLEGMPQAYLLAQLQAFASGARRNDTLEQMREVARALRPAEMAPLAHYYASLPPPRH